MATRKRSQRLFLKRRRREDRDLPECSHRVPAGRHPQGRGRRGGQQRQPYGSEAGAGIRHSVSTWGKGRGVARVQSYPGSEGC